MLRYALMPPYSTPVIAAGQRPSARPGALLVLRPPHTALADDVLSEIRSTQRLAPFITIALWLDLLPRNVIHNVLVGSGDVCIRAVITRPFLEPGVLRSQVADPHHLHHDVAYRLSLFGHPVDEYLTKFLHVIFHEAAACRTVIELTRDHGVTYTTLHRRLEQAGLGTPARLYHILRLLRIAIELQRNNDSRVSVIANRFSYWDDAALRRQFRDTFGVPPATVRQWIGWERLLYWAVRRQGCR